MTKLACWFYTHKYKEDYVKDFIQYLEDKYPERITSIRFKGTYDDFIFYIDYELPEVKVPRKEILDDYENLHLELGKWIKQCTDVLIKKEMEKNNDCS